MIVPIVFIILSIIALYFSNLAPLFVLNQLIVRVARNSILVMSLIVPVVSGMGLNFGIVLGAMAAQAGIIFIVDRGIGGLTGVLVATLIAIPIAIILGIFSGKILNRAKGREMITSMIMGFFANGIYQLIFIVLIGKVIPLKNEKLLTSSGSGLRNTLDLNLIKNSLDNIIPGQYPVFIFLLIALLFFGIYKLFTTKLGQDMKAIGQDMNVANVAGINVDRTRIIAIVISTVLAAIGQIVYLQSLGTLNTHTNHEQVGLFSVAALLIGGASVDRATWKEALLGTILFHLMFIVSPQAGKNLMGDAQIGEFFRVFIVYGVIGFALILYGWEKNKNNKTDLTNANLEEL